MKSLLPKNFYKIPFSIFFIFILTITVSAQTELLHLQFEDNLEGDNGEMPSFYDINFPITYQYGLDGKAAYFPSQNQLFYDTTQNIDALQGSMAYWIKPNWSTPGNHRIFEWGGSGGMLFGTDGNGYFVSLINVAQGSNELYANFGAQGWTNDQWYFVVHTWNRFAPTNEEALQVYVNGVKVAQNDPARDKNNIDIIDDDEFQIGGMGASGSLEAFLDDYIIFDYQMTDQEVVDLYNTMEPPSNLILEFNNDLIGASGETPSYHNTTNPVTFENGIFNEAAYFPSLNELRYSSSDNINDTIGSVVFWIKPDWNGNDNLNHNIFDYGTTGGMLAGKDSTNQFFALLNKATGSGNELFVSFDVSNWEDGAWYHAAFTWDKSAATNEEALQLYINGQLVSQNSASVPSGNLGPIAASDFQIGGSSTSKSAEAVIDRFMVLDEALNATEINSLFNEYEPPTIPGILFLEFENHLNGLCLEQVLYENPSNPVTYSPGQYGNAGFFPIGNEIYYEAKDNIDDLEGSISYWIKPDWSASAPNRCILNYGDTGGVFIGTDMAGNLITKLNNHTGPGNELIASHDINSWVDGQWYHVVHVWDHNATNNEDAVKVYIDGILVAQNDPTVPASNIGNVDADTIQIGGYGQVLSLSAYLDRFLIYDSAFNDTEVTALYNGELPLIDNIHPENGMYLTFFNKENFMKDAEKDGIIRIINKNDITINGNNLSALGGNFQGKFIHIENSNNIEIMNLDSIGEYFYAISAKKSENVHIHNNRLSGNRMDQLGWIHIWHDIEDAHGGGVLLDSCRAVHINDNTMQYQNDGVAMYECDSIWVENNNLSWNTAYGIRMFHSDSCVVIGNDCSHADRETDPSDCAAILLYFSRMNYVINNDFSYGGDGIFLNENRTMGNAIPNFPPSNNYFANNDCSYSPHNAIESVFTDGNTFVNNICNYSNYGFWLGYSDSCLIEDNIINNNVHAGIAIEHGFNNTIKNNEIKENPQGIKLWESGSSGLPGYTNYMSHDYFIDSNVFAGNDEAIYAHNTEHMVAKTNDFSYNRFDFFIEGESFNDTLSENKFSNVASYFINNKSQDDIYAINNYFPNDTSFIECKIFDNNDDPSVGNVVYEPFYPSGNLNFEILPPTDMAEPDSSYWTVFVEDGKPTSMGWDSVDKVTGDASLYINTGGGFDVVPHYWPSDNKIASWTMTENDTLTFWIKTENPHSMQFQQFFVRIGNHCGGYYEYTASQNLLNTTIGNWVKMTVPIAGNAEFSRSTMGNPSLNDLAYIEINMDTWDWGFEAWIDGVSLTNLAGINTRDNLPYKSYALQHRPNPVFDQTVVEFYLPEQSYTTLSIFDINGRLVTSICNQLLEKGTHSFTFDAANLEPGLYFYQLKTEETIVVNKLVKY